MFDTNKGFLDVEGSRREPGHLRGHPSGKKIPLRASSTKILANYASKESLINAVYDKNII